MDEPHANLTFNSFKNLEKFVQKYSRGYYNNNIVLKKVYCTGLKKQKSAVYVS